MVLNNLYVIQVSIFLICYTKHKVCDGTQIENVTIPSNILHYTTHSMEEGANVQYVRIALVMKTQFFNAYFCITKPRPIWYIYYCN